MIKQNTKNEALALLKDLGDITRLKFREVTGLKDSYWEQHFGTWISYKRAAGFEDNATMSKVKSAISRSEQFSDTLRKVNEDKKNWGDKYLIPSKERFQTILSGSDIHDKLCDPFYRRLFIDTAKTTE
jgi:hypothetical protein